MNDRNCIDTAKKAKGLTTKELARKLDIEYSVMKGIELGVKFPSLDILKKLCKILEISSDALLFNESREPLELDGLSPKQIETVRYLYRQLKLLKEGDNDGYSR